MNIDISDLAQRQLADYDRHSPGTLFSDAALTLTIAQAYELQIQVAALRQKRGEALAGYKVGCISESVRQQLGLNHPVFGHVFATELHTSQCTLDPAEYQGLAIEGEFAVRIAEDVPDVDWLREKMPGAISSVFAVIELHNYIFRSAGQAAQELIANNAIHAGVVLPAAQSAPVMPDRFIENEISVWINGELRGSTPAASLSDSIPASLLFLVAHLGRFGIRLRQGQIVLTGSPLPLYRISSGDRIEVKSRNFPTLTASIQPA